LGAAGLAVVALPMLRRPARGAEQASYFTWGGYDIPDLFGPYIDKHGVPPEFPVYADVEEAFQKLRAGFVVDVVHPCSTDVPRWRDAGLIQPIDTSKLSFWGGVFPKLKQLAGTQVDGKQWFVPFEWGQTSITYRTDLVDLGGQEESWGMLWDERYAGKIAMIGAAEDAWWCAAIYAGVDVDSVTEKDLEKVRALLTKQRPLVRLYTSDLTSVEQALASGEIVAAMTWNESSIKLKNEGVPVKFANPKEGALTWCCGVVMHKDAPEPDLAHDVIDALISPVTGEYVINEFGYGHSNILSFDRVSAEHLAELGLSKEPMQIIDRGVFVQPQDPDLTTAINRDWEEIIAGF
jgi:spermidine/putrescine transport system substrate-binding protein